MISRETRLSTLQRIVREEPSPKSEEINPRFVRSIQQSLAVEGIVCSEETIEEAGKRVLR